MRTVYSPNLIPTLSPDIEMVFFLIINLLYDAQSQSVADYLL